MSDPFMGEVRMFGGNYAPAGWALCNGQLLSISNYSALFSLLGTVYGGNGQTTFAVPDLRGRVPVHQGSGPGLTPRALGEIAGVENVTLLTNNLPQHSHTLNATSAPGNQEGPANALPATPTGGATPYLYVIPGTSTLNPTAMANDILPAGGSASHPNMMPSLCVNFIIALQGVFPARN